MKDIGSYLKEARLGKKLSLEELSKNTKIKAEFIRSIEQKKWNKLPEYPVVVGFVKNLALFLEIPRDKAVALLRRDYPPTKIDIAPKPDIGKTKRLGPRIVFGSGVAVIALIVMIYLGLQYHSFQSPPPIKITTPENGQVITEPEVVVSGETDPDATVVVNNQPALVNEDGVYSVSISVDENTNTIEVRANSRNGKESVTTREISVTFDQQ